MSTTPLPPFVAAQPGDSRSPCPALNALANHGYLPHNGRRITTYSLAHAMREVYNLSLPLAWFLSIIAVITCGNGVYINLHDLALHGRIEHDGSLVHDDALPGHKYAPSQVDEHLLNQLLHESPHNDFLTLDDLAAARFRRDQDLKKPLDAIHAEVAHGECALIYGVFANEDKQISKQVMQQWLGEEKLPGNWTRPVVAVGLLATHAVANQVGKLVSQLKQRLNLSANNSTV